jgi:hypothetical protein
MSEPLAERLSRFTPDGTGLDRDGLFFAAGRASARPNGVWVGLAGLLAVAQVVTLFVLWPAPTPPAAPAAVEAPRETQAREPAPAASEQPAPEPQAFLAPATELPPAEPAGSLVPDAPPLRAAALPSPD